MTAYHTAIWAEDSEGVLQMTDHYHLCARRVRRDDCRTLRDSFTPPNYAIRRLPFILLSACCLLAACAVFWVAGVAALYISYWSGVAGFILFWSLITAGIWCVGEAGSAGGES